MCPRVHVRYLRVAGLRCGCRLSMPLRQHLGLALQQLRLNLGGLHRLKCRLLLDIHLCQVPEEAQDT